MATFTEHLRSRGEPGLAALLDARPDLAAPPPATVRALAARATSRAGLERALASVDAQVLAVLEVALALDDGDGVPEERLRAALGDPAAEVDRATGRALDLALLWPADGGLRPSPGLADVLGPYPAGLGPSLRVTLSRRSPEALEQLAGRLGADDAADLAAVLESRLPALLEEAPPGARQVLDALTWGPPVGRSPEPPARGQESPARAAVEWLLRHGLLAVSDPQHVVLPREVGLHLRDGLAHRAVPEPHPAPTTVPTATVDAESVRHAEELVRLTAALVEAWGSEPPAVLRSGGLGVRDLRRTATRLQVDDAVAALVVEVAGAAGLVVDDGEVPPAFLPSLEADDWARQAAPERWQTLAGAWLHSERAAWLVGTRDDRGGVRPALDPEGRRPWAPRLRHAVLAVVGETGAGTAAEVHEVLRWRTPRSAPALHAVEAVLHEAGLLGVLGAGTLGAVGQALLSGGGAADVLAGLLPTPVDEVLLQGDLTGIVPGRPGDELDALLHASAEVESRGAAVTVRFTEASVRRALDAGRSAEDLLADLSRHARSGVPQPLEYLVLDTARRHGQVRAGAASSYLRSDDPALLAGLVEDRALRHLGLVRLAPTVLAAQVPPAALAAALRDRGTPAVLEGPGGEVVRPEQVARRARRTRRRTPRPVPSPTADAAHDRRLRRVAADLLGTDRQEDETAREPTSGTPDPLSALGLLREAAADGREVWLDVVGPEGTTTRRRVRPVRVDGGRVRVVDAEREAELTVAVHRIVDVTPTDRTATDRGAR